MQEKCRFQFKPQYAFPPMATPRLYENPPREVDQYYNRIADVLFREEVHNIVYVNLQPIVPREDAPTDPNGETMATTVWRFEQQRNAEIGRRYIRRLSTEEAEDMRRPIANNMMMKMYKLFPITVTPPMQIRLQMGLHI